MSPILAAALAACGPADDVTVALEMRLTGGASIDMLQVALVDPPALVDCVAVTDRTCLKDHLGSAAPANIARVKFDLDAARGAGQQVKVQGVAPKTYAVVVEGLDAASPPAVVATGCAPAADLRRPAEGPAIVDLALVTDRTPACGDPRF